MSRLRTNAERLITQPLVGEVWPPLADRHAYRVDADGVPFVLPGMGGVTLGVHPGEPATGWESDHLEPGASIRHRDPAANFALQFLTCVGNQVIVRGGSCDQALGRVIGQHAYVLADFSDADLETICTGDPVAVLATGQGLRLADHPSVVVKNSAPDLLDGLGIHTLDDGRLAVDVAMRIPAEGVGAGAGMLSEYANTDLMGAYLGQSDDLSLGLEGLRIGDVVVMENQDHRYGRGWRPGFVTVGVISTGQCRLFGHGPGPTSLISGPAAAFDIRESADANLARAFDTIASST